ncbi:hypothetical protein CDAR_412041 [Caerostris darwini]|uniref:Uncharacterized protein n=1 Tax=Caerostris darwini TaxID=1538125 RepID=A0AAV4WCB2_9ARAC|nr:hypothetical protein CDAR_412041 [Caerostris darwini]
MKWFLNRNGCSWAIGNLACSNMSGRLIRLHLKSPGVPLREEKSPPLLIIEIANGQASGSLPYIILRNGSSSRIFRKSSAGFRFSEAKNFFAMHSRGRCFGGNMHSSLR